ncbi:oxygenase MpaB family protein [Actinomycetospora lutea]|uniref:oxygenase MpaB family protein n=1 Tax=Actinomycetospora lutea TaxID=663604 RepID=UPI00236560B9|nr:oxygenase MpaB family protein [Actinomycetospora lutea]MDD7941375.1 oxygenase MpaB family protein [Actinomycetospora lutea]
MLGPVVLSATANVIMELSWPGVGHGVAESRVDSGDVMRHPLHRFRTTTAYLAVALLGTDAERADYRRAVGRSHAHVHATAESPVDYDAFDPELQRWVAMCLYRAFEDTWGLLAGEPGTRLPDAVYRQCATLGTTLQMRPEQWPADRAAFDDAWDDGLTHVRIDDAVAAYVARLIDGEFLPEPLRGASRAMRTFLTTGFLHEPFRSLLGLAWSPADQERFETQLRRLGAVVHRLPGGLRRAPYSTALADLRVRRALGRPLV